MHVQRHSMGHPQLHPQLRGQLRGVRATPKMLHNVSSVGSRQSRMLARLRVRELSGERIRVKFGIAPFCIRVQNAPGNRS
jgi:hypothetical protein